MKLRLVATCLFGLEHLLGEEIEALGYERVKTMDGRVTFLGDAEAVALANIFLRYAERVFIEVGSYRAESFDELFEGARALPWENFIGKSDMFPVKGHSIKSRLTSIPDCQSILKKAVARRLSDTYGIEWLPETGIKYQIEFFLFKDEATLMIDTSGTPLHKRGWRTEANAAPIRETLAAALVAYSRPRPEVVLWDPMCGSGTIAIEAALKMRNIAPGIRRHFAAESFPFLPESIWKNAREEAFDNVLTAAECGFTAYATDVDPAALEITKSNAYRAGVLESMKIFPCDARRIRSDGMRGTVVTNPPYGERMGSSSAVESLYRDIGRHFQSLAPWQVYIITSHPNFEALYGKRADLRRKLYNGMIPCSLYAYFKNNGKKDK